MSTNRQVRPGGVLAAAMMTAFLTTFIGSAVNLSIPAMEQFFGVNATLISWAVSAYTIGVAASGPLFGKMADILERRYVFLTGIAGFGLTTLLIVFVHHIGILIGIRAVQGFFSAMLFATNNAILVSVYPEKKQGHVIGYSVASTYLGLSLGPPIGGFLNDLFGWKAVFVLTFLFAVLAFAVSVRMVPGRAKEKDVASPLRHFDWAGSMIFMASVAAFLIALTYLAVSKTAWGGLGAAVIGFTLFYRRERQAKDPVVRVGMFRNRAFTLANVATLLNYGATFATSYMLSIYFQQVRWYSARQAGLILITMPIVQAILSPVMGGRADRSSPARIAGTGMGVCAAALVGFALLQESSSLLYVIAVLMLMGTGVAMFSSPNTSGIMSCVAASDHGIANSIIATMRTFGQSVSMALLTLITSVILREGTLADASTGEILSLVHWAFGLFVILCVAGMICSFLSRTADKRG